LSLNVDKTKTINFSKSKENSFDFLGFTLYWGKQNKRRILKVKTQKDKLNRSFKAFYEWIKTNRNRMKLKEHPKGISCGHLEYCQKQTPRAL